MSNPELIRGAEGVPVKKRSTTPRPAHVMTRGQLVFNWVVFVGGGGLILLGGALLPHLMGTTP
jgi:hypothetical protein